MKELDREMARALWDAGYMTQADYERLCADQAATTDKGDHNDL